MPQQPPELAGAQCGSGRWWRSSAASFCFPGALRLLRAAGIAPERRAWCPWVGRSPNVLGQGGGRKWAMPCPGGQQPCPDRREAADAVSWQQRYPPSGSQAPSAASSRLVTSRMFKLGRLSCGCASLGDAQAVYEILCVPGQRVPAGQPWSGAGGVGLWVGCCSLRGSGHAHGWCRGMGLDCREMSCWARIIQTGSFLPRLREVIRICKSALCSVLWKCEPICCFP